MTEPLHVLHLTDIHMPPAPGELVQSVDPAVALKRVLSHVLTLPFKLDACIISGDLTSEGQPEAYERLMAELNPLAERGIPLVLGLGNHDTRPGFRQGLPEAPTAFDGSDAPCCSTHQIGDVRVIVLDSHLPGQVEGFIGDEQLAWLDRQLDVPAAGGDLLVVHHPVTPPGIPWLHHLLLTNPDALASVVRERPLLGVLSGHVHIASATPWAGTVAVTTPAVAFQFAHYPVNNETVEHGHGYSLITIRDGVMTANPFWMLADWPLRQPYEW